MLQRLSNFYKMFVNKRIWRKRNFHNTTTLVNLFDINCVSVGQGTYGGIKVLAFNSLAKLSIGNFCSIAPEVVFLLSADHFTNHISTYPFKVKCMGDAQEGIGKGDIYIEDDVWIGYGATILSGVKIGQGAIVGAGSVVTKDVLPYSIVAGNPAKFIKFRFENEEVRNELMNVDYTVFSKEFINAHIEDLYKEISSPFQLKWLPRKDK